MPAVWAALLWLIWGSPTHPPILHHSRPVERFVIVESPVLIPPPDVEPSSPPVASPVPSPSPSPLVSESVSPPPPAPVVAPASNPDAFDRLAECESGGNYADNTGNGFYGAFQFEPGTWAGAVTRAGFPEWAGRLASAAPPAVQRAAAVQLRGERGWQPWPACSRKLGLR